MANLSDIKCVPCKGNEPVLSRAKAEIFIKELDKGWEIEGNNSRLIRSFKFKDFNTAVDFINKVGKIAEEEGHHPNIYLHSYNQVKLELWTHKIGGLHKNDFILASKIDNI
jgi:4a-hydroxytetrahydrobiopterin dehydratase